jgi:hypothetical protein
MPKASDFTRVDYAPKGVSFTRSVREERIYDSHTLASERLSGHTVNHINVVSDTKSLSSLNWNYSQMNSVTLFLLGVN